jgi:YegS/Rv2252/BmrU family lipid kinase
MTTIAVVAHKKKSLGGGLPELRVALTEAGITDPLWYEFTRNTQAPQLLRKCVRKGADLVLLWGGDGTVQRCIDTLVQAEANKKVELAIIPAGTANLLAKNLGIPHDLRKAVDIALHGRRHKLDIGRINGEHFAVMAGTGFDALMIRDASKGLKDHIGQAAYILTGLKNLRNKSTRARVTVDGKRWFKGRASCVLIGNVGTLLGGVKAFPDAEPSDGQLELGVVQAESGWDWLTVLARTAVGDADKSPLVKTGRGRRIDIKLNGKLPYQLDGGDRKATCRLRIKAKPHAITVCVPATPAS